MATIEKIHRDDVPRSRRQGGDVRILLSPNTTGSTTGFMGTLDLPPDEHVAEHYYPYSDEFMYVVCGTVLVECGEQRVDLGPDEAVLLPRETPHRFTNVGDTPAFAVFHIGPLAPRPELGHVDTEAVPSPADQPPLVGGAW